MSPLTHSLAGACIGYTAWKFMPGLHECPWGEAMLAGALLGNAPDLDTVLFVPLIPKRVREKYPAFDHRGLMHSYWLVTLWALMGFKMLAPDCGPTFEAMWFGVLCGGSHLLLDAVDGSAGFMGFAGISRRYHSLPLSLVRDIDLMSVGEVKPPPFTFANFKVRFVQEFVVALSTFIPFYLLWRLV